MHNTDGFALSPEELKRIKSREYEFDKESDALAKWLVEGNDLNDDIFEEVYTVSIEKRRRVSIYCVQAAKDSAEVEEYLSRQSTVTQSLQRQDTSQNSVGKMETIAESSDSESSELTTSEEGRFQAYAVVTFRLLVRTSRNLMIQFVLKVMRIT